jgi:hypothetical protein
MHAHDVYDLRVRDELDEFTCDIEFPALLVALSAAFRAVAPRRCRPACSNPRARPLLNQLGFGVGSI